MPCFLSRLSFPSTATMLLAGITWTWLSGFSSSICSARELLFFMVICPSCHPTWQCQNIEGNSERWTQLGEIFTGVILFSSAMRRLSSSGRAYDQKNQKLLFPLCRISTASILLRFQITDVNVSFTDNNFTDT